MAVIFVGGPYYEALSLESQHSLLKTLKSIGTLIEPFLINQIAEKILSRKMDKCMYNYYPCMKTAGLARLETIRGYVRNCRDSGEIDAALAGDLFCRLDFRRSRFLAVTSEDIGIWFRKHR